MLSDSVKSRLMHELTFSATRSSGPGGQNVNKVSTKIELRFNLPQSEALSDDEKSVLITKLKNKLTNDNELIITVQTSRSQLKNKEEAIHKFFALIEKALIPKKKRKPTQPSLVSKIKRVDEKKQIGQKKILRRKPEI